MAATSTPRPLDPSIERGQLRPDVSPGGAPEPERESTRPGNGRETERLLATLAGSALVLLGLRRRTAGGIAIAALGGGLVYRIASGRLPFPGFPGTIAAPRWGTRRVGGPVQIKRATAILRSQEEVFRFFRDLDNFRALFHRLEALDIRDARHSRWAVNMPMGLHAHWDVEITEERPNERIAWNAVSGNGLSHSGVLEFRQTAGGHGTMVQVRIDYTPPGGAVGSTLVRMVEVLPEQLVNEALHRAQSLLETGEIPTIDGQPSGRARA